MTGIILLSIVIVGCAMLALAIGAIFSRNRCLRGSCGSLESGGLEARGIECDTCPLRNEPPRTGALHDHLAQPPAERPTGPSRSRSVRG